MQNLLLFFFSQLMRGSWKTNVFLMFDICEPNQVNSPLVWINEYHPFFCDLIHLFDLEHFILLSYINNRRNLNRNQQNFFQVKFFKIPLLSFSSSFLKVFSSSGSIGGLGVTTSSSSSSSEKIEKKLLL